MVSDTMIQDIPMTTFFLCDTLPWAVNFLEEYRQANGKPGNPVASIPSVLCPWCPPAVGTFKVNTDAAIDVVSNKVGIGIIIQDFLGSVMASSVQMIAASYSPQLAEAFAIFRGLHFVEECGLLPYAIESDVQVVINLISDGCFPCSDVGLIIKDICLCF
ncbi:hypothetical protein EZV62_027729 [Acer yangbiense]|uniref:RNase H type-1 domain-containing protein n=1 Tax=Acer yangbiense TaxID=1000413 RepID=A0A5C7GV60_9ROSI|nr:hypothetical protein EZV62_027729 [Acer yangbiense]